MNSENGTQARLKPKALFFWRLGLLSLIGLLISLIFKLGALTEITILCLGVVFTASGCGFLFQNRKGFTNHDNLMANIAGTGCLLLVVAILAWASFR